MVKSLVSIIMPAYNHDKYIKQCFDSIINQTYSNIELIVINDGSTDKTHDVIKAYEDKLKDRFARFVYISKVNEGVCKTLNKGLDISNGEYIIPFASDDIMFPERVELQVNYLEKNKDYGMVYTDGYHVESDNWLDISKTYDDNDKFSNRMEFVEGELFDFMLTNVFLMPTPSICIRRECFQKVGKYDESLLCEDPDMFLRISKEYKIGYIKKVLVLHRIHVNNSGRRADIIVPSVDLMIKKYSEQEFKKAKQKEKLLETLHRAAGATDYTKIFNKIADKKLIGWGTGSSYTRSKVHYNFDLNYMVDSNRNKQGNILDGRIIESPAKLLYENKQDIFVIVFSQFYKEIYEWLEKNGFKYLENYY